MIGVYKIFNTIDGKFYIGSSVNIQSRFKQHIKNLDNNCHNNKYLQNAWNKYGKSAFKFIVIEEVEDVSKLRERENFYITETNCTSHTIGYNMLRDTNIGLGVSASAEVRKKISNACKGKLNGNYGRKHTPEELKKIRDNRWGVGYVCKPRSNGAHKRLTEEELKLSRKRLSEKLKGRKMSEETKQKLSKYRTGKKASEELKLKFSEQRKGSKNSNCKLTKEQVLEIYEKMNSGVNYKDVCAEYNIGQCWAYKIKKKEHWVFYE